jgi:TonB-dependent SusC/RagA subfamily outer membrane receptor
MKRLMLMPFVATIILQLLFSSSIFCQDIPIKGVVLDPYKQLLPGVSIKVKGSKTEAITDSNGHYNIMASAKAKLTFSCKGFRTQKLDVMGDTTINVLLEIDPAADREVNTGFGMVKESKTSQSSSSVDKKAVEQDNATSIINLLESVPGVKVVNSGGELKILIRGVRSMLGDNYAIVVLNGSVYYGSLKDLSVNNIKSIDVLKDASATAAYGSRGANGVVLITTK